MNLWDVVQTAVHIMKDIATWWKTNKERCLLLGDNNESDGHDSDNNESDGSECDSE